MSYDATYKRSFLGSFGFHLVLVVFLSLEAMSSNQFSTKKTINAANSISVDMTKQETVNAVSVDAKAVEETVKSLKEARLRQKEVEEKQHQATLQAAEAAKQARLQEQQKIVRLKQEEQKMAVLKQKQMDEERAHLKAIQEEKVKESKRVEEMKKQQVILQKQQQEAQKKLADLKKKQELDKKQAEILKNEETKKLAETKLQQQKANEENAKNAEEAKQKALAEAKQASQAQAMADARADAERAAAQARASGVVDKYKALIVNAIGRQWILPEDIDSSLSSQFRIRLAPDGSVLDVTLSKSSGDPRLDRSAQTAIYKASPLPVPSDASTFALFRDITLTVRPENVRGLS